MSTNFSLITEEFSQDLEAIRSLNKIFSDPQKHSPKTRIAAANSTTLLLAATFEEFVRQMARAYAKAVVAETTAFETLPSKMANTAWRRTMQMLARVRIEKKTKILPMAEGLSGALARFNAVYEFCNGDLKQDVYNEMIHNENNMRAGELNSLFSVSDLSNMCFLLSDKAPLLEAVGETEQGKTHARAVATLEEFIERRNGIAHSLNPAQSSGPEQILKDINFLDAFGKSLCETLNILKPMHGRSGKPDLPSETSLVNPVSAT